MADSRLKVAFLSLPQRQHAVLEYFIASTGQGDFLLLPDEQSEAGIFDFDNPESRHHWEHYHRQLGKPGVLLSVSPQQVPMTVWVQKPVTTGSMLDAAVRIKAGSWYVPPQQSLDLGYVQQPAPERKEVYVAESRPAPTPVQTPKTVVRPDVPIPVALVQPSRVEVRNEAHAATPAPMAAAEPLRADQHSVASVAVDAVSLETNSGNTVDARPEQVIPKAKGEWLQRVFRLVSWTAGKCVSAVGVVWRATARALSVKGRAKKTELVVGAGLPNKEALLKAEPFPIEHLTLGGNIEISEKSTAAVVEAPVMQAEIEPVSMPVTKIAIEPEASGVETIPEAVPAPTARFRAAPSQVEVANAPLYCGVRNDIPGSEIPRTAELFYPYDYYMVSALREAYMVGSKWRSPTRLDLDLGCVFFLPTENCAYIDFPEEALFEQSVVSQPRRHKVRMVGVQEFDELETRLNTLTRIDRFDATLWKLGMTTSKGRLPVGTDVNKVFYLKCWPNMTRLEHSPFSLRIAALLATRGATLLDTARILDIPQRYVFAFYNAALATDIVTEDGTMVRRALRRVNRNQGRFLNLFKWLRG